MKTFNKLLKKIATPICQKHGFVTATVLMDWHLIVGEKFAAICQPEKIAFPPQQRNNGLLYIATSSAFAPELSYLEAMIIDKVNKYFGYNAVQRLVIRHKRISQAITKKPEQQVSNTDLLLIEDYIKDIEDPNIKTVLRNIGAGIYKK